MGISIWQLLIILVIVLLIFGAKRLRSLGTDLGASVKGFRDAMKEGEAEATDKDKDQAAAGRIDQGVEGRVIDGEVEKTKTRDKA